MKNTINKNDIVIINKNIDFLKENDIVAINNNNTTIIKRIYQIDEKNIINYDTIFVKGDNNLYPDNNIFKKEDIEGKVITKIPWLGILISFLQTKVMTLITIVLLCLKFKNNEKLKKRTIDAFKSKSSR